MNHNSLQDDRDQEQQHHQQTGPETIFTNIYNVISGARQSASQEFTRFWESLGHAQRPYYPTATTTTSSNQRRIKKTTSLKNKQHNRNNINGRFLPDDNVRGIVKDVEIQTDDLLQQTALSIPHKRASSAVEEYHIPFPVKKSLKRTSFSQLERNSSFDRPSTSTSRRIVTLDDEHPKEQQQQQQEEKESISHEKATKKNAKESLPPPPPSPPSPPKMQTVTKGISLSPSRMQSPKRASTSKAVGRFTPSPSRDIMTGSKSVRRLTLELEEQFTPRFPSPFSPKKQQDSPPIIQDTSSSSLYEDEEKEDDPPSSRYQPTPLVKASVPVSKTFNFNHPIQPSPASPNVSDFQFRLGSEDILKDDDDHYANQQKQKELDERVNKLEEKVSIARTKVTEFSSESITSPTPSHTILSPDKSANSAANPPSPPLLPKSNNSSPKGKEKAPFGYIAAATMDSPTKESSPYTLNRSNRITSLLRSSNQEGTLPFSYTASAASAVASNAYEAIIKSPIRDTIAKNSSSPINKKSSVSPYRSSLFRSTQQQKEANSSPPMSYAAAKAAIQEAVGKKSPYKSPSSFGERISSVRSTMTPSPQRENNSSHWRSTPPRPPPPPSSSITETSTYAAPKNTPSPYLQHEQHDSKKDTTPLKPNDKHKSKMKELIQMIPAVRLRKTDTIM